MKLKIYFAILLMIFNIAHAFNKLDDKCELRLIIGSGRNIKTLYPFAREVTKCDITIDKNRKLHPTYIININDLEEFKMISVEYAGRFEKIIFEHLGDGFASFVKNAKELEQFIKWCRNLLKTKGVIIYESSRGSTSYSDNYRNKLDLGIVHLIEQHYQALEKTYKINLSISISEKFNFIKRKYKELLQSNKFNNISIIIKQDKKYREFYPKQYPYYYLEIRAESINDVQYYGFNKK